ncbi:MAG: hypothetical protein PHF51_00090 [Candidatus ainarchaeum sp.]|nr:hypothetical protein [Candidatus ainarchaeum sp.]
MATITGGRIIAVEAKRDKTEVPRGMNMNVEVRDVSANKDELSVEFAYTVQYKENVATMKITGIMQAKEEPKKAKEIARQWKDEKKLNDEFAEMLMNYVSYAGGVAGTFFSQALGLNAPLMLMPIRLKQLSGVAQMQGPDPKVSEKDKAA